jgi:hypothetical protein
VDSVFGKINYGGLKHNSLYLGLVLPSGGDRASLEPYKFDIIKSAMDFWRPLAINWVKNPHEAYFARTSVAKKKRLFF